MKRTVLLAFAAVSLNLTACLMLPVSLPAEFPIGQPGESHAGETPAPLTPLDTPPLETPPLSNTAPIEQEILRLTNQERAQAGLSALREHPALQQIARRHSQDMAERGYFEHTNPEGQDPTARLRAQFPDTELYGAGENIIFSSQGAYRDEVAYAKAMLASWMNSPGHRDNILRPSYRFIGIGFAQNQSSAYATQNFAD